MRFVDSRDRSGLEAVSVGIYLMQSGIDLHRFRSGVIGIRGSDDAGNNAFRRIGQLNTGDLKQYAPWSFALLFDLGSDRRADLGRIEKDFQALLHSEFAFDGRMFRAGDEHYAIGFAKAAMRASAA